MKIATLGSRRSRTLVGAICGATSAIIVAGLVLTAPAAQAQDASSQVGAGNSFSPQVTHTQTAPTGYTVTFRYRDPSATRVQVQGEWYFSDPAHTTTTSSQGLLPNQWQPGDIPVSFPNSVNANWPVTDMQLDPSTGVWELTLPLPSGIFTYGFFVNCPSNTGSGCTKIADPSNLPWNIIDGVTVGSVESDSEVYVPSDPAFGTVDYSWQAPSAIHGRLIDVSYDTMFSTNPPGSHPLAIYTPPGYNPSRSQPYPTLYISHGAGGHELKWSTQGVEGNIIDNLISAGLVQPMVVVMTNMSGLKSGSDTYAQDVITNVIPYVEAHYNVSKAAADRAFAGNSAGGQQANNLLFNHTSEFGAYSIMSNAGGFPSTPTAAQIAALRSVAIQIGGGRQDPIRANTVNEEAILTNAGVPFVDDSFDGGHEWYVWRILLHDFVKQTYGYQCSATITSDHHGPLAVSSGVLCLDGATQSGPINVQAGAGLIVTDGVTIAGPVNATSPTVVRICGSQVSGPIGITGGSDVVVLGNPAQGCAANTVVGPVNLTNAAAATVVGGNTITGPLNCTANDPAPGNDGSPNNVTGPKNGQCATL
jgi:enterochelin esterase-like enzyme